MKQTNKKKMTTNTETTEKKISQYKRKKERKTNKQTNKQTD